MGVGHHTCHHLYRLASSLDAPHAGRPQRLTAVAKLGVPQQHWPTIAHRITAGASLRALADRHFTTAEKRAARAAAGVA